MAEYDVDSFPTYFIFPLTRPTAARRAGLDVDFLTRPPEQSGRLDIDGYFRPILKI